MTQASVPEIKTNVKQGAIIGGWLCFVIGLSVMYASVWLFFVYGPLLLAALILSIVALAQRRILMGIVLLLVTLIVPPAIGFVLAAQRTQQALDKANKDLRESLPPPFQQPVQQQQAPTNPRAQSDLGLIEVPVTPSQVPETSPTLDGKVVLSILRSETMSSLAARRTVTQIVVERTESDSSGEWRGVLWATVSWRYGADLSKIQEKDIRRQGETIFVRLPEPQLLDFAVEPSSIGFMSKSTAVTKAEDSAQDGSQRQQLENEIKPQALKFATAQRLCPSRQDLVRQLNESNAAVQKSSGIDLRFE